MNLLVNATSLVEQLNFSNVYWHDIDRKEWWETKGAWLSLDQIFDNGREPTKIYGELNYD